MPPIVPTSATYVNNVAPGPKSYHKLSKVPFSFLPYSGDRDLGALGRCPA